MLVRIGVCFVLLAQIAAGQVCVPHDDFAKYCDCQYDGIAVGGRCFFLAGDPPNNTNLTKTQWDTAFSVCQKQGDNAILAQVYSEREMKAIWGKYQTNMAGMSFMWIALQNHPKVNNPRGTNPVPPLITADTCWYSSATVQDTRLTVNNTFLRNRANDDLYPGDGECLVLLYMQDKFRVGDLSCTYPSFALCMITNNKQDFTLTPDSCFMEPAIVATKPSTVNDCATACAGQTWCRTFNYRDVDQTCQLFALHAEDAPTSVEKGVADCSMYTVDA